MPYETVRCEVDESILTITLNRPDKLNTFTTQMLHEMIDAFDRADKTMRLHSRPRRRG